MRDIIYIHGFASSGNSFKGIFLREKYGKAVVTPNLSCHPLEDMTILKNIIKDLNNPILIGSSLGGFYAWYLSKTECLDALLINPLSKVEDMKPYIGTHEYFETGLKFNFTNGDFQDLLILAGELKTNNSGTEKRTVLVAKDDSVIPYNISLKQFVGIYENVEVYDTGGHSFNEKEIILNNLKKLMLR